MSPGGIPPVIHVSQYDSDFTIVFTLFSTVGDFTIESGTTAMVRGTKSSGTGYSADAAINISAKTVTVTGDAQMTAAAGQNVFEIVLKKNNKEISSKNFILHVERAALDADTITDESVLRELDAIIEGAETATQAAEDAEDAADRAEAAAQLIGNAVTYTAQSKTVIEKAQARNNLNAQESLGVEHSENLFDSEDVTLDKVFYSSDPITRELRDREGYFASGLIDVSNYNEITINGCEIVSIHGENQATITPIIQPQNTLLAPNTYTLDDSVKYIRVAGKIANIDSVYIRKPEFTIPHLKLTPEQTPIIDTSTLVSYTEAQNYRDAVRAQARENISAQESLGVEYSENIFDSENVNLGKKFFASDPITMLRDDDVFFASNPIDVSNYNEITIRGCEVVGAYDANQATITPKIEPQNSMLIPATYDTSEINYIRVVGRIARINDVYIRKPDFTIPHLKLTSSQAAGNEYITPEMFGAVGDGETDDSNAFALTIADGRPIKLMAKTYKANLYINRSNVTIEGVFGVSRLMPADPTKPIIKINSDSAVYIEDLVTYVTLRDFIIYGNWQNVVGLHARACQYCWFERLWFHRCFAGGLVFEGVWDSKVRDCDVVTCGNRGMEADDGFNNYAFVITKTVDPTTSSTKMKSNALVIDGCHFEHIPRCFDINNVFQVLITNCKYESHCRAYGTNPEYSPIRVRGQVKGLHFVNNIFTYNGVNVDDTSIEESFSDGIPFITVDTEANEANAERITVISNCQFATQPGLVAVYFSGNQTLIDGCNFDRCATLTSPIVLKDFCSLVNCDMLIYQTGTVVNVDGAYSLVDNLRIFDADEDVTKPVIKVTNSARCGYVKAIYNGTNRNNLAEAGTEGFKIPVEFIGLRSFPAT